MGPKKVKKANTFMSDQEKRLQRRQLKQTEDKKKQKEEQQQQNENNNKQNPNRNFSTTFRF